MWETHIEKSHCVIYRIEEDFLTWELSLFLGILVFFCKPLQLGPPPNTRVFQKNTP
jgi:hypothetical protein